MRRTFIFLAALVTVGVLAASHAAAGQGLVSTMANVDAVSEKGGFYLAPASGFTAAYVYGDEAPPQVFEIIRPRNARFSIGRLHTSCSCVQVETAKTTYEQGERAFLVLRNIRATPPNGQNYAIYAQIVSPIRTTLRIDTFMQSDRYRGNAPVVPQPVSYPAGTYLLAPNAY